MVLLLNWNLSFAGFSSTIDSIELTYVSSSNQQVDLSQQYLQDLGV